jgi:predicted anti-sigma-YlaC factor YlaD
MRNKRQDQIMDCETSKRRILDGRQAEVADHLRQCEDCRQFAIDYDEISENVELMRQMPEDVETVLAKVVPRVRQEMRRQKKEELSGPAFRSATALVFAILFAPIMLGLNYAVATGGQNMLAQWLPKIFGEVFFFAYLAAAAISFGLTYGALPILLTASRERSGFSELLDPWPS